MPRRTSLLLLAVALGVAGCKPFRLVAAQYPRPDIAELYAGEANNRDRNPIILIPGFAGSELVRAEDQKVVWGAFFTKDAIGHSSEEGLRAFALDLSRLPVEIDHPSLRTLEDDAIAVAPLERIRTDALVTHVNFKLYASLLDLLRGAGYVCDEGRNRLEDNPERNCFTFFYDWRQDNVGNVQALGRFIAAARSQVQDQRRRRGVPEGPVRFDIVAHSMGGLLARYYLRYGTEDVLSGPLPEVRWAGARGIDRLILVSTPNFGTMKALRDLIRGRRNPVVATFQPTLLASLPSLYQMLPRERHQPFVEDNGRLAPVEFMAIRTWIENEWGPFAPDQDRYLGWLFPGLSSPAERRARMARFMEAAFERARRFAAALDEEASTRPPTTLVLFTGDAEPTLERARVQRKSGRLHLAFEGPAGLGLMAPGDGTVTRASALADERSGGSRQGYLQSPVPWDWTFFISDRHTTFLRNPTFQNNLLHLLLERPPGGSVETVSQEAPGFPP